ncbi:MAG: orotidine-5'-phosphate decarboxylase [Methanobacteriota archaeon]|nr:MAG: orotidine-5'-phosphate decarboxylase [Euryarchaeota archaeon]
MRRKTRLIVALDVTEESKALRLAADTKDYVDAFKVNVPLVLARGMGLIDKLAKIGDVICDFKVADIPNTNRLIVDEVFRHHAKGIIVHGFVGEDSVRACVDAARGDVFVVAEMSHPGAERWNAPIADEIARLAVAVGAAGIIAPATRPDRVKALRAIVGDKLILSPGVGAQGGTPADPITAGADYIIVGRAIYDAENPRAEAEKITREIARAAATPLPR